MAACRSGDAALDAAAGDALEIDASGARVTLQTGVAGAHVYFLNADSSVARATVTGNDGTASGALAAGGSVTVIQPPTAAMATTRIYTFTAVQPGDALVLALGELAPPPQPITFDLTYPLAPGATSYELRTSCGLATLPATTGPVAVTLTGCGSAADLALVATDGSAAPVGVILASAQPVAAGQPLALAGPYVALAAATITLTDVPAGVASVALAKQDLSARSSRLDGFLFEQDAQPAITAGSGSATLADLPLAAGLAQLVTTTVSRTQSLVTWGSDAAATTVDVGASVLPDYATRPAFSGRTLGWTAGSAAAGAPRRARSSPVVDSTRVTQTDPTLTWQWTLAAPGDPAGALVFPLPPSETFDFAGATLAAAYVAELTTLAVPGGYAAIRQSPFGFAAAQLAGPGTAGQVAITQLAPDAD